LLPLQCFVTFTKNRCQLGRAIKITGQTTWPTLGFLAPIPSLIKIHLIMCRKEKAVPSAASLSHIPL